MNLLRRLFYKIYLKKVINYTNDLCYHMNQVYHYILSSNLSASDGKAIAEAVGLLDTWKKMSTNVFTHIKSSTSIEIKNDSKLIDVTKKVLEIEIDFLIKNQSKKTIDLLKKEAFIRVEEYFDSNKVVISKGS
ncbi:MAG: hypothetical protein UT48_C0002G0003 [Parcubacteria group bacterium GW2011_GWE2_39_37]|nr:MAG: hypothetical protein UT48_C0002G0003 [Parcubacteria group bacterium GW2011_GWE2_39_37]